MAEAARNAENILPVVRQIQAAGAKTIREIAAAQNARGVATPRGAIQHATSVKNLLDRAA